MNNKFKGTGVAIVTPFNENGSIDFPALESLLDHLINNGIDYFVVQGTTGESATLSLEEKNTQLKFIIEANDGRLPVILGIGGNNTQAIINSFKEFDLNGVDAILSVSPYYNKPSQEGLYQHYRMISENTPLPVILYNVPGRTSSNITAETTLKLSDDFKNIIGIKEASGNLNQIGQIIGKRREDFLVLSGDDALTLPILAIGGDGVISVIANAFPKAFSQMVKSALSGDFITARHIHLQLMDITMLLFAEGNPAGIKAALKILGIISSDSLRLPLAPVSKNLYHKLEQAIKMLRVN